MNASQKLAILRLIQEGVCMDGWAHVSVKCWPLIDSLDAELVEREHFEDGSGRARLTDKGIAVAQFHYAEFHYTEAEP